MYTATSYYEAYNAKKNETISVLNNNAISSNIICPYYDYMCSLEPNIFNDRDLYWSLHIGAGIIESFSPKNISVIHYIIDFAHEKADFYKNEKISTHRDIFSKAFIDLYRTATISGVNSGPEVSGVLSILYDVSPKILSILNTSAQDDFKKMVYELEDKQNRIKIREDLELYSEIDANFELQKVQGQRIELLLESLHTVAFGAIKKNENGNKNLEASLIRELNALGIDISDQLHNAILNIELLREEFQVWIAYQKESNKAKCIEANYQGLYSTCQFINAVSKITNSRALNKIAVASQAGISIFQATSTILAQGLTMSVSLLNPISAIGMSALSILSLFQKDQISDNQIILEQIQLISQQIQRLRKEMAQGFNSVHQHINYLFENMMSAFSHTHYLLEVPINRQLTSIKNELSLLFSIVSAGFNELINIQFEDTVNAIQSIKNQKLPIADVTKKEYHKYLNDLTLHLKSRLSSPLQIGMVYKQLLESPSNSLHSLSVLKDKNQHLLQNLVWLLAFFAKKHNLLQNYLIDENQLFQVELWLIGIKCYSELKDLFNKKFDYQDESDISELNLKLQNQLSFIKEIQSKSFYENISTFLSLKYKNLTSDFIILKKSFEEKETNGFDICTTISSIESEAKEFTDKNKLKVMFDFSNIKGNNDKIQSLINEEFCYELLQSMHFYMPDEIIFAVGLGMGDLQCTPYLTKFEEDVRKSGKKEYTYEGKVGIKLQFIPKKGDKIVILHTSEKSVACIFPAGSHKSHRSVLLNIFKSNSKKTSKNKLINNIRSLKEQIEIFILSKRKEYATIMADFFNKNNNYNEIITLNHFISAYLTYAGLMKSKVYFEIHFTVADYSDKYHNYYSNSQNLSSALPICEFEKDILNIIKMVFEYVFDEIKNLNEIPSHNQSIAFKYMHECSLIVESLKIKQNLHNIVKVQQDEINSIQLKSKLILNSQKMANTSEMTSSSIIQSLNFPAQHDSLRFFSSSINTNKSSKLAADKEYKTDVNKIYPSFQQTASENTQNAITLSVNSNYPSLMQPNTHRIKEIIQYFDKFYDASMRSFRQNETSDLFQPYLNSKGENETSDLFQPYLNSKGEFVLRVQSFCMLIEKEDKFLLNSTLSKDNDDVIMQLIQSDIKNILHAPFIQPELSTIKVMTEEQIKSLLELHSSDSVDLSFLCKRFLPGLCETVATLNQASIGDLNCAGLFKYISLQPHLKFVDLSSNNLLNPALLLIARYLLLGNSTIKGINLLNNPIDEIGLSYLAIGLKYNYSITSLEIHSDLRRSKYFSKIETLLKRNKNLEQNSTRKKFWQFVNTDHINTRTQSSIVYLQHADNKVNSL